MATQNKNIRRGIELYIDGKEVVTNIRSIEAEARKLTKEVKSMKIGSDEYNASVKRLRECRAILDEHRAALRGVEEQHKSLLSKVNEWVGKWQTMLVSAAAAVTGLVMAGRKAVSAFAEMDEQLANTRKYTGLTEDQVNSLNNSFKHLDTRTARDELNLLAQEAGRLGKNTVKDVQGYVEAADIINVALVDLGKGATQEIAKLSNIFGVDEALGTKQAMLSVGSAVNVLSQNCTASKPYLVEFTKRMAGIGAQADMTIPELLAFGAVLDSNGQASEMSASALGKLIMMLFQNTSKMAKAVGLDVEKFTKTMQRSTTEGVVTFLSAIQKMGGEGGMAVLAPLFKELGADGVRMSQVLATVANHIDEVNWQLKESQKAFDEASSATNEYNIFNSTVQAGLDKARKRLSELAIALGQKLAPVMKHVYSSSSMTLKLLSNLVSFVLEYRNEIATLVGTYMVYRTAVVALNALSKTEIALMTTKRILFSGIDKVVKALITTKIALQVIVAKLTRNWAAESAAMADAKIAGVALTNAYAAIAAAAALLVVGIIKLIDKLTEATALQKSMADAQKRADDATAEQILRINTLTGKINDNNLSNYERKKALTEIKEIIPGYNALLDEEGRLIYNNTSAIYDYIEALKQQARMEAVKDEMIEREKQLLAIDRKIAAIPNAQRGGMFSLLDVLEEERAKIESEMDTLAKWAGTTISKDSHRTKQQWEPVIDDLYKYNSEYKKAVDEIEATYGAARLQLQNEQPSFGMDYGSSDSSMTNIQVPMLPEINGSIVRQKADKEFKNQANIILDARNSALYDLNQKFKDTKVEQPTVVTPTSQDDSKAGKTDKFDEEKKWREKQQALARIAYATGRIDYDKYVKAMDKITIDFYAKELEHTDLSVEERLSIQADYYEAQVKQRKDIEKLTIEDENKFYDSQVAALQNKFINMELSQEEYDNASSLAELEHLRKMVLLTEKGSKERAEAEKKYRDRSVEDMKKRQKEVEDAEKKHQDRLKAIKEKVFGLSYEERKQAYDEELALLTQVYEEELRKTVGFTDEYLRVQKEFEEAKAALQKTFLDDGVERSKNAWEKFNDDILNWLNSPQGKAFTGTVETITNSITQICSAASSLVRAQLDLDVMAIEQKYDSLLESVKGNALMEEKIQREKEEQIAKKKTEATKKMYGMQVAEAVAQTAMGAINAFSSAAAVPLVGYILAPIAAATAVAAGAVQIATIKKQRDLALAQGYASGGYTPSGAWDEPQGVVHSNEFVANRQAVANPEVRPVLDLIDAAQRSGSIANLSSSDIAAVVGGGVTASAQRRGSLATQQSESDAQLLAMLARLNDTMRKATDAYKTPSPSYCFTEGNGGVKEALDFSNKMYNNAER